MITIIVKLRISSKFIENCDWPLLLNGFNETFMPLNSFNVTNCGLVVLDKLNLWQFREHLIVANFKNNLLTYIMEDLFEYNNNLTYCDFSDNPLAHIPDYDVTWSDKIRLVFNNVECDGTTSSPQNKTHVSNCKKPTIVLDYENLEENLRKKPDETYLLCSSLTFCINNEKENHNENAINTALNSKTIFCYMNVVLPRTVISICKVMNSALNDTYGDCDEPSLKNTLNINNILNHRDFKVEYIPENFVYFVSSLFKSIKITSFKLVNKTLRSINEYDMIQFGDDIQDIDFSYNLLKVIKKNVFEHNRNLQTVNLEGNPIIFIDSSNFVSSFFKQQGNQMMARCRSNV